MNNQGSMGNQPKRINFWRAKPFDEQCINKESQGEENIHLSKFSTLFKE
jgi:hypothetical protein